MMHKKKIIVGVCGSVAAIETPKLVRELRRKGAEVYCIMSLASQKIISKDVLEWASDNKAITEITGMVEHVKLVGNHKNKADVMIIAPSTANTIGKIANGIDDTPVTTFATTAIGSGIPLIIVPAMHISMYAHPILQENISKLKKVGINVLLPKIEENKAKFPDINYVIREIESVFVKKDLINKKILVTAGATIEEIDPVRYITNKSSGKMGIAIANEAFRRGAEVTLIRALTSVEPKYPYKDIRVRTGEEMFRAIKENLNQNAIIHVAAVSDFQVNKTGKKIKSDKEHLLKLETTVKIIDQIKKMNKNTLLVGFKAEYNLSKKELINAAFKKLKESNADLIVANDVSKRGAEFGSDTTEVFIVDAKKKVKHIKLAHKRIIANKLLDEIKWML